MCIMCNSYEDAHCTSVIRSQKTDNVVDTKFQTNSQDMGQVRSTNLPFIRRSVENRQFAKKVTKILLSSWRLSTSKQYESYFRDGKFSVVDGRLIRFVQI